MIVEIYNGVQTAGEYGRSVMMYGSEYMTAGGLLTRSVNDRRGEAKEFKVMDYIGNVRQVLRFNLNTNMITDTIRLDYRPFGDTVNCDESQRLDFIERERDFENGYIAVAAALRSGAS